ncbi:MAG: radical SAM protein [Lachnospiraceae bacterium]|nr:radical SAM protein [Lachnospiraceae bacterium]
MNMTGGVVYRPPYEADSLLLQVTLGCSHNKCTFCYMYPDVQFTVCPMEQIEADIEKAARYWPDADRVFLEHGDAFVLSSNRLMQIADAIHYKLPNVETIAMYASIQNIKHKADAELRSLRNCGINGLDIGVESGLDAALKYMNKGHTAKEAQEQLLRLTKAGIDYSFNAILGCGGADLWRENAEATADLINAVQPHLLFIGTLHAQPECRLYKDMRSGAFMECTCGQLLDEQKQLISRLDLKNTYYFGSHPSNLVPMQGKLPKHKQEMLVAVQEMREQLRHQLDEYPVRGGEGSVLNQ